MRRFTALVFILALVTAACGGGAELEVATETTAAQADAPATTTTVAPTTTTTVAPTTTTTTVVDGIVPGEDADVDAIVLAYQVAFDSTSDFDTKAPYIDDPAGLEDTVAQYLLTGETMGGIAVNVREVTVDGDSATLVYDLMFNDNPTYPDLAGRAVRTEAGWQVPRGAFCSLMSSARVGCPSE
ncbi:MAG: hypothetical protein HKN95_05155 [Acidimicrobiia bacterium]|nr:hypothetical protein [Acidimicrobiia bacterium]